MVGLVEPAGLLLFFALEIPSKRLQRFGLSANWLCLVILLSWALPRVKRRGEGVKKQRGSKPGLTARRQHGGEYVASRFLANPDIVIFS